MDVRAILALAASEAFVSYLDLYRLLSATTTELLVACDYDNLHRYFPLAFSFFTLNFSERQGLSQQKCSDPLFLALAASWGLIK